MDFDTAALCEALNQYNNIIVYGMGYYAQEIYPYMIQGGLKEKIICFTQTNECKNKLYNGIPVININELDCNREDCVVLVATSELYTEL